MALSEKIELLGKGLYKDIPDILTLTNIPTASELDYVGREDFDETMLNVILPQAIVESINPRNLLEIDYHWICRALRILNYGPFYTTNVIYCDKCGASHGEYRVNLNSIECKPLPTGFKNEIKVTKDEFIEFDGDVILKLPTIQDMLNADKDDTFKRSDGRTNRAFARMCYMIKSVGNKSQITPIEVKMILQDQLNAADYEILKERISDLTDYGVRAGGTTICPKCHSKDAAFVAMVGDKFFRPTLGDLREWKNDRSKRSSEDLSGSTTAASGKHN